LKITNISGRDFYVLIDRRGEVIEDVFHAGEVVTGITNYTSIRYFLYLQSLGVVKVEDEGRVNWKKEGF
jgi:hypothetical protein